MVNVRWQQWTLFEMPMKRSITGPDTLCLWVNIENEETLYMFGYR